MLSIVIIDNYPVLRLGVADLLKSHFKDAIVTEMSSLKNLLQHEKTLKPDLIILGINDNSKDKNLNLFLETKLLFPLSPIIVYDEIIYDFQTLPYLEFGIEGYVLKHKNSNELIRCIEIVLNGKRYVCNDVLQNLYNGFLMENSPAERKNLLMNLRNRV